MAFDSFAYIEYPFSHANTANKDTAINIVDNLGTRCCTSIGAGLDSATAIFTDDPEANGFSTQNYLLLSDGKENTEPWVSETLPDLLDATGQGSNKILTQGSRNIVHTIAFEGGAPDHLLQQISHLTGGVYAAASAYPSPVNLHRAYQSIEREMTDRELLVQEEPILSEDEVVEIPFRLGQTDTRIKIQCSWAPAYDHLNLDLIQPDGSIFSPSDFHAQDWFSKSVIDGDITVDMMTPPQFGRWTARITGTQITSDAPTIFTVSTKSPVQTEFKPEPCYVKNDPIPFRVRVHLLDQPVFNADVNAYITIPVTHVEKTISLFDDGAGVDSIAGDGIYAGSIDNSGVNLRGRYKLKFIVTGTDPLGTPYQKQLDRKVYIGTFIEGPYRDQQVLHLGGVAASWGDYDNDGDQDVAILSEGRAKIYKNSNHQLLLHSQLVAGKIPKSATWGDYDNNDYLDLFIGTASQNYLYHNDGNGEFSRILDSTSALTSNSVATFACSWVDYNNDGNLDMFTANQGINALYKNMGDGTFTDINNAGDLLSHNYSSRNCGWVDYNKDGYIDVAVVNNNPLHGGSPNALYKNNGDGTFEEVSVSEFSTLSRASYSVSWADFTNNGYPDIVVANDSLIVLYKNNQGISFTPNSIPYDANGPKVGRRSSAAGDYDNDGYVDLFVGGNAQHDILFHNNGDGTFTQITDYLINYYDLGTSTADWVDVDTDGDLDLFKLSSFDAHLLYSDEISGHWITINAVRETSMTPAIGATISAIASANGEVLQQSQTVSGQTGVGAQNDMRAHFGLGELSTVDTLRIVYPDGSLNEITHLEGGQSYTFTENSSILAGTINHDRTLSGFQYVIDDVEIPTGVTLTIEPGTTLKFAEGKKMQIDGSLLVNGDVSDSVVFKSNMPNASAGDWAGIILDESDNVELQYANIRDAKIGLTCFGAFTGELSHLTVSKNRTGIYCEKVHGDFQINHSQIGPNKEFGIWSIASKFIIDHNNISANEYGGIYAYRGSYPSISYNTISNNGYAENNSYSGVEAIDGSDITMVGITREEAQRCESNNEISLNALAGVKAANSAFPVLGKYNESNPTKDGGYNRIYGNRYSIINENREPLYAQVNYWIKVDERCSTSEPYKLSGEVRWHPSAPVSLGKIIYTNTSPEIPTAINLEIAGQDSLAATHYYHIVTTYFDSSWVYIGVHGLIRCWEKIGFTSQMILNNLRNLREQTANSIANKWVLDGQVEQYVALGEYNQALTAIDTLMNWWANTSRIPIYLFERGRIEDYQTESGLGKISKSAANFYQQVVDNYSDSPVAIQAKVKLEQGTSTSGPPSPPIPTRFYLYHAYPNPFNPQTTIRYDLPTTSEVTIKVFDLLGRQVTQLIRKSQEPGTYETVWNGTNRDGYQAASGIYFILIQAHPSQNSQTSNATKGTFRSVRKVILLR